LFKEVLHRDGCNLVIIGYGFRDAHINAVILEGIQKYSLRLFVVSSDPPGGFRWGLSSNRVEESFTATEAQEIWSSLHGYYFGTAKSLHNSERPGDLSPVGKTLFHNLALVE
jgi:hypothetical protein